MALLYVAALSDWNTFVKRQRSRIGAIRVTLVTVISTYLKTDPHLYIDHRTYFSLSSPQSRYIQRFRIKLLNT